MMYFVPKTKAELNGVLQEIWTYAPDNFADMYCSTPERPTLESDYEELRQGIEFVFRQKRFNKILVELRKLVDESFLAYKSGENDRGMELIEEVQIMIGKMK